MPSTAPDIIELEKKLEDGEGDDALNSLAIKIFERLADERSEAKFRRRKALLRLLEQQNNEFGRVLLEIKRRRHLHVLDRYAQHVKKQTGGIV
jgi:hypothetical protein